MITGIEHVAICAKDSTELKDWYKRVFGFQQIFENDERTYFLKSQNGFLLEFIQETESGEIPGEKQGGIRHIALTVDEFADIIALLASEKIDFITEPVSFLNSVTPDSQTKETKLFLFRDPEGNVLHLTKRKHPL